MYPYAIAAEDSWWSMLRYTSPVNVAPPLMTFDPRGDGEMILDSGMIASEACVSKQKKGLEMALELSRFLEEQSHFM